MKININRFNIFIVLATLAFIQPGNYVLPGIVAKLLRYYTLGVSGIFILLYVLLIKNIHFKVTSGLIPLGLSFVFSLLFSSVLNYSSNIDIINAIRYLITIIGYICFVAFGMEINPKQFMKGYLTTGLFLVFIHLCTILMYHGTGVRQGITMEGVSFSKNWFFLCHANASFFMVFPVIVILYVYCYLYNRKMIKYVNILLLFTIVCFYVQWSVAGLIGFTVFGILMFFENSINETLNILSSKLINLRMICIISVIAEFLFAFMGGLSKFTDLFYQIFQKQGSISHRVEIWENAVVLIKSRFILGYGWLKELVNYKLLTNTHTHNILLEFLYCGGILAVIFLLIAIHCLIKQVGIKESKYGYTKAERILILSTIPFVLASSFDFYMYRYHYIIVYVVLLYLVTQRERYLVNEEIDQRSVE